MLLRPSLLLDALEFPFIILNLPLEQVLVVLDGSQLLFHRGQSVGAVLENVPRRRVHFEGLPQVGAVGLLGLDQRVRRHITVVGFALVAVSVRL